MAETVAQRVWYTGAVQGVGFRATTAHMARRYPVAGWVRNMPDGRVQLCIEGSRIAVEEFLAAIRTYWGESIHDERREDHSPEGRNAGFQIMG